MLLQAVLCLSSPHALTVAILTQQSEAQETDSVFYTWVISQFLDSF